MIKPPPSRRLRVLAFDPSFADRLDMHTVNQVTLSVPWERLEKGPIGEYVEVVDYDPSSKAFWKPVNLDDPHLLAQDGLAPSETNPQFHQQMVYAVAMATIRKFESALGRPVFWSDYRTRDKRGKFEKRFVERLRIYPHALRERNAYYSPRKKALLFGYFPVEDGASRTPPGTVVFTCLSHDIVAHEVTHALLDGVHPRFNESTNPDVHAFHEAFADIVALFQHFSYPQVLESQIRRTRGALDSENLLGQLAQQFGRATGRGSALRDAIGEEDNGVWRPKAPDPRALESIQTPHERGSILVAAVFRAFLLIYRQRTADLYRIATQGTGTLPEGDIHPDLARRLAEEASRCAERVLQICIRAIDYCPPVNVTFGDYLRALVTADVDYAPDDERGYRLAFLQSFREWGVQPIGIRSVGLDALVWPSGDERARSMKVPTQHGRSRAKVSAAELERKLKNRFVDHTVEWSAAKDRFELSMLLDKASDSLWHWLYDGDSYGHFYAELFGLDIRGSAPPTVYRSKTKKGPAFAIHSVRPAIRRTVHGGVRTDLVVEITQKRRGYFDPAKQREMDSKTRIPPGDHGDFTYRAGCTILVDPATQEVRRVIPTAGTISDSGQLDRVRRFLTGEEGDTGGNAFDAGLGGDRGEPFALLHQEAT